jgi:hypothetical protein
MPFYFLIVCPHFQQSIKHCAWWQHPRHPKFTVFSKVWFHLPLLVLPEITVDVYGHWISGEGRDGLENALLPVQKSEGKCISLHIQKEKPCN